MATTDSPAGIRPGSSYWPSLDGLRGLAITVIFAYHAYPRLVPGAAISVDLFFVLSAFLITTLLVREHTRTGRIDLRAFYRRRVLRLLPAVVVVIPVAAVLAWWLLPAERAEVVPSARSVLLYYANFRAAAQPEQMSVFLPTWSLSTEEQFYAVWPTLLVLLYALRTRPRALIALVAGLVLASTLWLQLAYEGGVAISAIVYRPDLRLSGILIGTLAGLVYAYGLVPDRARSLVKLGSVAGTGFVLVYLFRPQWIPTRVVVTLAIVTACVAFAAVVLQQVSWPWAPFTAVLAMPALVWTGRASYALYLVHVPVLRLLNRLLDHPGPWVRVLLGGLITLLIGGAIHTWIEKPALRLKERRRTPALAP